MTTYIHKNRERHESGIIPDQRSVLIEAMVLDETLANDMQEVPVEEGVHNADQDLRNLVPVLIDLNKAFKLLDRN